MVLIGKDLSHPDASIVDASNHLVLPGAIDANTHLGMPLNDIQSADNYETGTRAAACGGTTTIFDYVIQRPGEKIMDTVRKRKRSLRKRSLHRLFL